MNIKYFKVVEVVKICLINHKNQWQTFGKDGQIMLKLYINYGLSVEKTWKTLIVRMTCLFHNAHVNSRIMRRCVILMKSYKKNSKINIYENFKIFNFQSSKLKIFKNFIISKFRTYKIPIPKFHIRQISKISKFLKLQKKFKISKISAFSKL